jgi:phage/plasmid-like protein (TIGR03299 family)
MAHQIDMSTGKAACFVTGKAAWHGLGTVVETAQTSEEAIKLAGLNWKVEQWPMRAFNPDDPTIEAGMPGSIAIVRTDTKKVLGHVSKKYHPLQNVKAFDFFDSLVGDKLAMFETAGSLFDGRIVWILARIPGEYYATSTDMVKPYVLLMNSHDGKSPLRMIATAVRVVCNNTLNMALHNSVGGISIKHYSNMTGKIEAAREALGIVRANFDAFDEEMHAMIKGITIEDAYNYFDTVTGVNESGISDTVKEHRIAESSQYKLNYEHPTNMLTGIAHTVWSAANAVTQSIDHGSTYRGNPAKRADNRFNSIIAGTGAMKKREAWDLALSLV